MDGAAHQLFIEGEVFVGHPPGGEAVLKAGSYLAPVEFVEAPESAHGLFFVVDDETSHPFLDRARLWAPLLQCAAAYRPEPKFDSDTHGEIGGNSEL
jgi:hypothetical protein